jgi:hypothetical protein
MKKRRAAKRNPAVEAALVAEWVRLLGKKPDLSFVRREIEIIGSGSSFADGEPISSLPLTAQCVSNAVKVWAA